MSAYTEYVEGKVIISVKQSKRLIDLDIHPCSASLFLTKDIYTSYILGINKKVYHIDVKMTVNIVYV